MTNELTRRTLLGAATVLCLGIAGCKQGGSIVDLIHHRPRTTLVLIDASASIAAADRAIYIASLQAVANTLEGGDLLVVAHVGDEDRSAFRAALDITVPNSNVRLDREAAVAAARAQLNRAVPSLVPEGERPGARSTLILSAIAAGAQAYGAPHEGDRLILLSDAVEEGPLVNLARMTDPGAVPAALDKAAKAGLLPALDGVEMTVAGAGGAKNYDTVQRFWTAYVDATHMHMAAYGRLPFRPAA